MGVSIFLILVDLKIALRILNWKIRGIIYFVILILSLLDFTSTYQALGNVVCIEGNPFMAPLISSPDLALLTKIGYLFCFIIGIEILIFFIYYLTNTLKEYIPKSELTKLDIGVSIVLITLFLIVLLLLSITVINNYLCYLKGHTFL